MDLNLVNSVHSQSPRVFMAWKWGEWVTLHDAPSGIWNQGSFSDVESARKTDNCLFWPWPDTEWLSLDYPLYNPLTSSFLFLMQFHPGAHISLGSLDLRRHPVLWISSRRKWPGPCLGTGISWIGQCPDNCLVCTHQHWVTGLLSPQHSMIFLVWCYGNECRMAEAMEQAKETALILCCCSLSNVLCILISF